LGLTGAFDPTRSDKFRELFPGTYFFYMTKQRLFPLWMQALFGLYVFPARNPYLLHDAIY
jgi:hypothetical protein